MSEPSSQNQIARTPKANARVARKAERKKRVFELRKRGLSIRKISDLLTREAEIAGESTRGLSYPRVRIMFREMIDELAADTTDLALEYRCMATERLEDLLLHWMPYARIPVDANTPENIVRMKIKAGDIVIKANRELAELYAAKQVPSMRIAGKIDWREIAREAGEMPTTQVIIEGVISDIPRPPEADEGADYEN